MHRFHRNWLVAAIAALATAFALRLLQLGTDSLWYDETVSVYLAAQSVGSLIDHTARDIHPPLYYILLHYWTLLAGSGEYVATFFSLWWGVVLLASAVTFARWLGDNVVALITAAVIALSPFNIWYSQEVRMYTMGATLALWSLMALWQLLRGHRMKKRWMTLWVLSATAGLYTLYYFAFLLLWEALFVAWWLRSQPASSWRWQRWITLGALVTLFWSPWLKTALRQATEPPVPPWREATPIGTALLESLSALALGQSMSFRQFWPMIVLLVAVIAGGIWLWHRQRDEKTNLALLLGALLLPLMILLFSSFSSAPLYHVRYLFTFSAPFYILLAMSFTAWVREAEIRARLPGAVLASVILMAPLVTLSAESLQRFWNDPAYAADDLRGGIAELRGSWSAGDVLLLNAGYAYTALTPYFDDPIAWRGRLTEWQPTEHLSSTGLTVLQSGSVGGSSSLGWGQAESDFYATSEQETIDALERVAAEVPRLWQLRIYDTVTDPTGVIRKWLDDNALLFHDQLLSGESNARLQGWYFPPSPEEQPARRIQTTFLAPDESRAPWITLHGIEPPAGNSAGGGWVDITLWLEGSEAMDPSTRLSLGLFDTSPAGRQWTVVDEHPMGELTSLSNTPGLQRWPVRLRLPQGIPPGKYEARLKFYRPGDGAVLLGEGERLTPNREQVVVAIIEVAPTPPLDRPPEVGTPMEARFGPLQFLGHAIPPGPWEPGASISMELVWRLAEPVDGELRAFLTSDALLLDDGGVAQEYPPEQWRLGEVVRDIHNVTIAPDVMPGDYPLFLRVSQGSTTVPWTQGFFQSGDVLQIGVLTIKDRQRSFEPPAIANPLDIVFGDSIQLIGATLPNAAFRPGEQVPLTLNWYAMARPPGRYKIFVHLIGPDGNLRAQRDLEPGDGLLPTNGWARGEYVTSSFNVPLGAELPPGQYEIRVGLYDPTTNERIALFGPGVNADARYTTLGALEIVSP